MNQKLVPPKVIIRRYPAFQICDVVVSVRGREIVLRCPSYSHALKWACLECKSYKISELRIEPPLEPEFDDDDLPLFLKREPSAGDLDDANGHASRFWRRPRR